MTVQVRAYADAARFEARVAPWLLRREAEHNLLLGLLPRLASGDHAFGSPIFLASVEVDGEVAGCAFRTPPYKLALTRMPEEAIEPLVEQVAGVYDALPMLLGPEAETTRFAELWCQRRGGSFRPGTRQCLHSLERAVAPQEDPAGSLRVAQTRDLPLLAAWIEAFCDEVGTLVEDGPSKSAELLHDDALYVWDDGTPRAMVGVPGFTAHGARIAYVYTPPPLRRRGLATSAVAALSGRLLRGGRRFCFLYTDLANPTSNAIYRRIGYEPVCEVIDVHLEPGRGSVPIHGPEPAA